MRAALQPPCSVCPPAPAGFFCRQLETSFLSHQSSSSVSQKLSFSALGWARLSSCPTWAGIFWLFGSHVFIFTFVSHTTNASAPPRLVRGFIEKSLTQVLGHNHQFDCYYQRLRWTELWNMVFQNGCEREMIWSFCKIYKIQMGVGWFGLPNGPSGWLLLLLSLFFIFWIPNSLPALCRTRNEFQFVLFRSACAHILVSVRSDTDKDIFVQYITLYLGYPQIHTVRRAHLCVQREVYVCVLVF